MLGVGLWLLNSRPLAVLPPFQLSGLLLAIVGGLIILSRSREVIKNLHKFPETVLLPVTFGVGLSILILLGEHAFAYLIFPYPLDDGEGFCLNQAVRLASGEALYPPISTPPWVVTNYPPVYPTILSWLIDPARPTMFGGRLISIISTVMIAIAASGCVRSCINRDNLTPWIGWITIFLVVCSPVLYFWAALLRVDILATALGMIALWIAVASRGPMIFLSLPFLLAAMFTRQSSVEAFIAIAVWMLFGRAGKQGEKKSGLKESALFILAWIAGVVVILLLLNSWSDGEFWRHTVTYTRTRFFPERIWSNLQWILPAHAILFIVLIPTLVLALRDPKRRIIGIFCIASIGTALLSGKVGSDLNYFLNLVISMACLAALLAYDGIRELKRSGRPRNELILALLLIPAILIQTGLLEGNRSQSYNPERSDYMNGSMVVEILSGVNGPILSEDEGFCLLAGHEVLFNPFIMSEMAREGIWNQAPLVQAIENREFDIIMLRFYVNDPNHDDRPGTGAYAGWDRFTTEVERAISANYEVDLAVSPLFMRRPWFIYRPEGTMVYEDYSTEEETMPGTGLPDDIEPEFTEESTVNPEAVDLLGEGE